jgi:hypothetical protein
MTSSRRLFCDHDAPQIAATKVNHKRQRDLEKWYQLIHTAIIAHRKKAGLGLLRPNMSGKSEFEN